MPKHRTPRFHVKTMGCPKNEVDSEGMHRYMEQAGFRAANAPQHADVLIVNTCGFVGDAVDESVTALEELAARKRTGQRLVAAGCLAERLGEALLRQVGGIDALLGTRRWSEIAQLVGRLESERTPLVWTGDPDAADAGIWCERAPTPRLGRQATAYVKIADGCSAPCAFCTIPTMKGPYRSRQQEAILAEAAALAASGTRELILIAQDTTSYGADLGQRRLPELLRALSASVPEARWIRLMYAYPQFVSPELIDVMASTPSVCRYLDLPLQHAHPDVLRRMRRPSDMGAVRRLLDSLREAMPDIALRTTFIVGYPGETESEFQALLDFMSEVQFDKVGVFAYSREEGTPAADLPSQILDEVSQARRDRAMEHQQAISLARNAAFIGRKMDVLIEGCGDGLSAGRTYRDAPEIDGLVLVPGEAPVGEFVSVRITGAMEYDLVGEIADP